MTTDRSQAEKADHFRALHLGPRALLLPNPWDAGSARALAGQGFQALATSSGASAAVLGRRDGEMGRAGACARHRHGVRPAGVGGS